MTPARLRELMYAQPFQPFTMHMADGRGVPVRHREFVMPSPKGRTVVVFQPDGAMNIIDLRLVTDLEPIRNGRKRRKQKS